MTAVRAWRAFRGRRMAANPAGMWEPAGPGPCTCQLCRYDEPGPSAMTGNGPLPPESTGCRWLMLAAEMAGLVDGSWRSSPHPARAGREFRPRIATCVLGAEVRSAHAARDFTFTTLSRWGTAHSSQDIAVVVSELVTNTLRHAMPGPGATGPPGLVRLGLLQHGPCLLCAVADPSKSAPVPRAPGALAEDGRGLQMICALSDKWGYTKPSDTGKVVWAMFIARRTPPSRTRYPAGQAVAEHWEQHADDGQPLSRIRPYR